MCSNKRRAITIYSSGFCFVGIWFENLPKVCWFWKESDRRHAMVELAYISFSLNFLPISKWQLFTKTYFIMNKSLFLENSEDIYGHSSHLRMRMLGMLTNYTWVDSYSPAVSQHTHFIWGSIILNAWWILFTWYQLLTWCFLSWSYIFLPPLQMSYIFHLKFWQLASLTFLFTVSIKMKEDCFLKKIVWWLT